MINIISNDYDSFSENVIMALFESWRAGEIGDYGRFLPETSFA